MTDASIPVGEQVTTDAATPGIGDNKPPSDLEFFKATLLERVKPLRDRALELEVGAQKVPLISGEEDAARATDFVGQLKAHLENIEGVRVKEKAPHKERADIVQGLLGPKGTLVTGLKSQVSALTGRIKVFRDAKEAQVRAEQAAREAAARREAEEQARLGREAAEKARLANLETPDDRALAKTALQEAQDRTEAAIEANARADKAAKDQGKPVQISGNYGTKAFSSKRWTFEITDKTKIPALLLWPYIDDDAIAKAINRAIADKVRKIPGVLIQETSSLKIR